MNGFISVNKPLGMTSSDVVVFVRKRLPRGTRVGHGGTLDPEASGVLPVCVGGAARLFDYIIDKEKTYEAVLALGAVTDTQDATGTVVEERPVNAGIADIEAVLPEFTGEIEQIPPMYSAIKKDGKRLYQLARKGEAVEVPARKCRVYGIEVLEALGENRYRLRIRCGKGVYIRTLCHDIGARLGCGGHMAALERTAAGAFTIARSLTLPEIDRLAEEGKLEDALLPMDYPIGHIPRVDVGPERMHAVKNGNPLKAQWLSGPAPDGPVRIYIDGIFCGMGEKDDHGSIRFKAMLL
jgi:tRNA pseudouridine55 synthase